MSLLRLIHEIREVNLLAEAVDAPERPAVGIRWEGAGRGWWPKERIRVQVYGYGYGKIAHLCCTEQEGRMRSLDSARSTESVVDLVMLYRVVMQQHDSR